MNPFACIRRTLFTPLGLSLRLAIHEWASALCQCFALSAVVLPILLLLGFKNGLIESEKNHIMNDPDALLLAPRQGMGPEINSDLLESIRQIPGVHDVLPQLALSDTQVYLLRPDEEATEGMQPFQITLTRAKDKTLEHYGCRVPAYRLGSKRQEAVLNHAAKERLGVSKGGVLRLMPARTPNALPPGALEVTVIDILPPDNKSDDGGNAQRVFLAEELAFDLANYYDGFPCSFTGESLTAPPMLSRALLLVPARHHATAAPPSLQEWAYRKLQPLRPRFPLNADEAARLLVWQQPTWQLPAEQHQPLPRIHITARNLYDAAYHTTRTLGWSRYRPLMEKAKATEKDASSPTALPAGSCLLGLNTDKVDWEHMGLVKSVLPILREKAGADWQVYPWNPPVTLSDTTAFGPREVTATAPWNRPDLLRELSARRVPGRCVLYTASSKASDRNGPVDFSRRGKPRTFDRCTVVNSLATLDIVEVPGLPVGPSQYFCAPEDLCMLSLAHYKTYRWNYRKQHEEAFSFPGRVYAFRCYARDLHAVAAVKAALEEMGFKNIISSAADIAKFLNLEKNLRSLLLLIGTLAGTGAVIALWFNLFNATERRKKEYAILRTLGLGRIALLSLPVYETAIIMAMTLLMSFGAFHVACFIMQRYLSAPLPGDGQLCSIPSEQQLLIAGTTMVIAIIAALISSIRLCLLSPAAYIRES